MFSSRVATIAALAFACLGSAAAAEGSNRLERRVAHSHSADLVERARTFTPTGSSTNTNRCTPLELVYFRSAREPQAHLGLLGDPLYELILKWEKKASAFNVPYDDTLDEMLFTNIAAGKTATEWINKRSKDCPSQRYIVAGFSKGAIPVHLTKPTAAARERIVASLAIGDTFYSRKDILLLGSNSSWPSNGDYSIRSLCNVNDKICWPGGQDIEVHLYQAYLPQLPRVVKKWIMPLYERNLAKPFKYEYTPANHH